MVKLKPVIETACRYLTTDSRSPLVATHTVADAGKMAHYMVRWQLRDGTFGAWGETVSATITG